MHWRSNCLLHQNNHLEECPQPPYSELCDILMFWLKCFRVIVSEWVSMKWKLRKLLMFIIKLLKRVCRNPEFMQKNFNSLINMVFISVVAEKKSFYSDSWTRCLSLAEQIPLDGTRSFQIHIFKFDANSVSFICDGHNYECHCWYYW